MADEKLPTIKLDLNLPFKTFNVNEGVPESGIGINRMPSLDDGFLMSVNDYAGYWEKLAKSKGGFPALIKDFMNVPPATQSFGRMSFMPTNTSGQLGVLQWPGLPPASLQKLAREMIAVNMIINIRETDIMRYADVSDQPWRPGWKIVPVDPTIEIDDTIRKEIKKAQDFVLNSGYGNEFTDPIYRDDLGRPSFSKFLLEIVRDSLTYDGIAVWVDRAENGKILSYAPLPAHQIRLLARPDKAQISAVREGELNFYGATSFAGQKPAKINTDNIGNIDFAVVVDETGNIVETYTREELLWYVRNPRVDAEVSNYGYPEMEQALTLITGFNNAIQFNADIFDKNSIPKGILAIKGNFTQRQFDALGRIWDNMQRGNRTDWTLPALQLSEKGEIEIINLEPLRKEPAYYNNLINLFMGALATLYGVPVHRLGYKISGTERDSRPDTPKSLQTDEDTGLPALLTHIEIFYNTYILSNRWPHLKLVFTGKSPKEDARLYEQQTLSMTWNEKRQSVGLPKIEDTMEIEEDYDELVARLMGNAPVDPGMAGIYQSMIAALAKGGAFGGVPEGEGGAGDGKAPKKGKGKIKTPGARFPSKKDPAISEEHGHMSGVRRDSKTEKDKNKAYPRLRRRTESYSTPDTQSYSGNGKF